MLAWIVLATLNILRGLQEMQHSACSSEHFPLALSLSLRERSPRTLIAPCAHEPVFEHSFISNNLRVRFMGREQQASDWYLADGRCASSVAGVNERQWTILSLLRGESRSEGKHSVAHSTIQ